MDYTKLDHHLEFADYYMSILPLRDEEPEYIAYTDECGVRHAYDIDEIIMLHNYHIDEAKKEANRLNNEIQSLFKMAERKKK